MDYDREGGYMPSVKDTPIFICSKDRLSFLKELLATLLTQGYWNLYVVDTGSTFMPMVEFLHRNEFATVRVSPTEYPQLSLWTFNVIEATGNASRHFVWTDCDVVPDCPDDWLSQLYHLMNQYSQFRRVGLGLRLDDLPDCYCRKQEVIAWENQFWKNEIQPGVFDAAIDTTLALYPPGAGGSIAAVRAIRTGGKYVARHLPWYSDSANPTEEERWYKEHMAAGVGHWR